MKSCSRIVVSSLLAAAAGPACAADGDGTAAAGLFALAAAILLALVMRRQAGAWLQRAGRCAGRRQIARLLRRDRLDALENFILPANNGDLARIDLAIMTPVGIVCVRVKHCNGMLFARAGDPQWAFVDGVHRKQFLNPLIQNEGRTRVLRQVVPDMPVSSLVVFTGNVQFSRPPATNVIHVTQLSSWLERHTQFKACAHDPEASWLSLRAAARTDQASHRDFEAQLSFG